METQRNREIEARRQAQHEAQLIARREAVDRAIRVLCSTEEGRLFIAEVQEMAFWSSSITPAPELRERQVGAREVALAIRNRVTEAHGGDISPLHLAEAELKGLRGLDERLEGHVDARTREILGEDYEA